MVQAQEDQILVRIKPDRPGDLDQMVLRVEGGAFELGDDRSRISARGPFGTLGVSLSDLAASTSSSHARTARPVFSRVSNDGIAIRVGSDMQESVSLVITPGLEWSTFLDGDSSATIISDLMVGPGNTVIAGGQTSSADFPTTPGAFQGTWAGGTGTSPTDVIISCFEGSGSELVFSTFIGGANSEGEVSLDLAADGGIVVGGRAGPGTFPITPGAFDPTWHPFDSFVAKLSASGDELLWGTYLGGDRTTSITTLEDLVVDASGDIYVVGGTGATDFPVTPDGFDTTFNDVSPSPFDGYVSRLSSDGTTLVASTFLGGSNGASVLEVELTEQGWVTVAGGTSSSDFPVTPGAYDTVYEGSDGFVAQFDPLLSTLRFSSFVGGPVTAVVRGMDVDASGCITLAGHIDEDGLPTTPGAFDATHNGGFDGWVARFDPTGSHVLYATYLGGGGLDLIRDLAVDSVGVATVVGESNGSFFPTTPGAYQESPPSGSGFSDVFVSRFSPTGELFYSTYLGGSSFDGGGNFPELMSVALTPVGSAIVGHRTQSLDFPTTEGAFDTTHSGVGGDGFVAKLSMLPTGIGRFGGATPGCSGPLSIDAMAMAQVGVGSPKVPLTCTRAPALTPGWLAIGVPTFDQPHDAAGALGWVDFAQTYLLLPVSSDRWGYSRSDLGVPDAQDLIGQQFAAQFFWPDACGPAGWSASNALAITIQP